MGKLTVGNRGWYNGADYDIVGTSFEQASGTELLVLHRMGDEAAIAVVSAMVEQPIQEQFKVGDQVRTYHTFEGDVVGFERDTNRAICRSIHTETNGTRKRYAYKGHELMKFFKSSESLLADMPHSGKVFKTFIPGKRYLITALTGESFAVVAHNHAQQMIPLITLNDLEANTIVVLPADTTPQTFKMFGILQAQQL